MIQLLRHHFPVRDAERFSDDYWKRLQKECAIHVAVGQLLFPVGLIVGAFLFPAIKGGFTAWDLGVAFGCGVVFACGYQLAVCTVRGFSACFKKMSDYSTMMYGIPWAVQFRIVYLPFLIVGTLCAVGRLATS